MNWVEYFHYHETDTFWRQVGTLTFFYVEKWFKVIILRGSLFAVMIIMINRAFMSCHDLYDCHRKSHRYTYKKDRVCQNIMKYVQNPIITLNVISRKDPGFKLKFYVLVCQKEGGGVLPLGYSLPGFRLFLTFVQLPTCHLCKDRICLFFRRAYDD